MVQGRPVRLMFQDEARFGRMVRPKRCWAPAPLRPVMSNGYEREFVYVYGAVSPLAGELDWRVGREMNTTRMGEFLARVSQAHPGDLIVMVLDGASSHKAKDLPIPENIRLLALPPYAPELNPQEHVWDELREKEFPNRVFNHLDAVIRQLQQELPRLAADQERLRSLTAWPWILSLNLNAHQNKRSPDCRREPRRTRRRISRYNVLGVRCRAGRQAERGLAPLEKLNAEGVSSIDRRFRLTPHGIRFETGESTLAHAPACR